jgi:hypothetical protein
MVIPVRSTAVLCTIDELACMSNKRGKVLPHGLIDGGRRRVLKVADVPKDTQNRRGRHSH